MRLVAPLNIVRDYQSRFPWLIVVVFLAFIVLILRLGYLQLSKGQYYRELSEHNFVQELRIPALRGNVLDRNGNALADNRPAYSVYLTPAFMREPEKTLVILENYLALSPEESLRLRVAVDKARGILRFREIQVKIDITRDQLAMMEGRKFDLAGVNVRPEPRRNYPFGELFGHSIGYVGRISDSEILEKSEYHPNSVLGKSSLEKQWEKYLRGEDGFEKVVVDAYGRRKGPIQSEVLIKGETRRDSIQGANLVLSLDLDMQKKAEELFAPHKAGSVVVLDVNTGYILVWYSKPGFDPNKFVGGISQSDWQSYSDSILEPLIDKATQATYFPGSTYKVVGAIAGLENGAITEWDSTFCGGSRKLGSHTFHCWKRSGHGSQTIVDALQHSCDVFFYEVGERQGHDKLYNMASIFGLGEKPGLGVQQESAGILPSQEWHQKMHGRKWFTGDTLSHVIGQGDLKTSPLQIARLYATIANGGKLYKTQVVQRMEAPDSRPLMQFQPVLEHSIDLKPDTLRLVKEGLRRVVNEPGGTAFTSRLIEPQFSGKTGSSQVIGLSKLEENQDTYLLKDHAWFASFAPSDNPEIVVVIQIEHGEHGSWGAPVARDLIAYWYEKKTGKKAEYPSGYIPPAVEE